MIDIEVWQIWIAVGLFVLILEIFTPAFFFTCVTISCFAVSLFTYFDYGIKTQLVVFSLSLFITFFYLRPIMLKYFDKNSKNVKTNMDALIGKTARVSVTIDNSQNQGRVIIDGDDWKAVSENDTVINKGEIVRISKLEGVTLTVKK